MSTSSPRGLRFGVFEIDLGARVLRKNGLKVRLQEQPYRLLIHLVERPGEVVTREELREKLWPNEEYGEFDLGLNTAVKKVRAALGDSATSPKWIETIPKVGYRFLGPSEQAMGSAPRPRPRATSVFVAVGFAALIGLSTAYLFWPTPDTQPQQFVERPLTFYVGSELYPSFSPDGERIAYSWDDRDPDHHHSDIFVQLLGGESGEPMRLTEGPESDWWPAWSPNGTQIAFVRSSSHGPLDRTDKPRYLMLIDSLGGQPRRLAQFVVRGNFYAKPSWSPDGRKIFFARRLNRDEKGVLANHILVYSFKTGETIEFPEVNQTSSYHPSVSPDGSWLTHFRYSSETGRQVIALALDDRLEPEGDARTLPSNGLWRSHGWSPEGGALFFFGKHGDQAGLWRMSISGDAQPHYVSSALGFALAAATGPSGETRIAYAIQSGDQEVVRVPLESIGAKDPEVLIHTTRSDSQPQYSADGSQIVFVSDRSGSPEIWISNQDGNTVRRVTATEADRYSGPTWLPGGRLAAEVWKPTREIHLVDPNGGGQLTLVKGRSPGFSRDGRWVYYFSEESGSNAVWRISSDGTSSQMLIELGPGVGRIVESPDARLLYVRQNTTGTVLRVSLDSEGLPIGDPKAVLENVQALDVVQSGVYYRTRSGELRVYRPEAGETETLMLLDDVMGKGFSVSPDGRSLIYARQVRPGYDLRLLESVGPAAK